MKFMSLVQMYFKNAYFSDYAEIVVNLDDNFF